MAEKKKWMQKAFAKNKGKLHRELGVPEGEPIPAKKMAKAEKKANKVGGTFAKEINLAKTSKHIVEKHKRK